MHIFKKVHVYVLRQLIHVDGNSYKLTSIYINNIVLFDNIRKKTILKYNLHSAHNIDYQNGTSEPFMYCCPTLPSIYGVVATGLRLAINSAILSEAYCTFIKKSILIHIFSISSDLINALLIQCIFIVVYHKLLTVYF